MAARPAVVEEVVVEEEVVHEDNDWGISLVDEDSQDPTAVVCVFLSLWYGGLQMENCTQCNVQYSHCTYTVQCTPRHHSNQT